MKDHLNKNLFDCEWFVNIWVVINPIFWLMNYSYNETIDHKLIRDMKSHMFNNPTDYHITLNNSIYRTSNYPFAYGFEAYHYGGRPSRQTIFRMNRKIKQDLKIREAFNRL